MGCTSGTEVLQAENVDIEGVDMGRKINRNVPDFKFAQERL
jgi:hypothetical protein